LNLITVQRYWNESRDCGFWKAQKTRRHRNLYGKLTLADIKRLR